MLFYKCRLESLSRERNSRRIDISRAGWIGDYPDPFTFLDMMVTDRGNNKTGYNSRVLKI